MRFRRLDHRYAMLLTLKQPTLLVDDWHSGKVSILVAQPCWRPAADVYETADKYYITVELAGVELDDLEVIFYQDAIVIEGERPLKNIHEEGVYHIAGIRHGAFRLELIFSNAVDAEKMSARYEQGLLYIELTKVSGAE